MEKKMQELIANLEVMKKTPYIGYGNPDSEILIIGKECAIDVNSDDWKKFYNLNYSQWDSICHGGDFDPSYGEPYDFEHKHFNPKNPFYPLKNRTRKKKENGYASKTYFYYQRLIDLIYGRPSPDIINFFSSCFITELNDLCRRNNKDNKPEDAKKIKQSIQNRFSWMREVTFFRGFKVVILACGPYANAIKKDELLRNELFGTAHIEYCHQLSQWDKSLIDDMKIDRIQRVLGLK